MICGNHHLTIQEIVDELGITIGSCQQILTKKLQMHYVWAKFVPHLLIDDQKENHAEIS